MFRDRAFNLSILFSATWHLFWIASIYIVITPSVQPSDMYQEVDFLGPILEKTAFDLMVEQVKPQAETLYARSTVFTDKVYLKPAGPGRKVLKEFIPGVIQEKFAVSIGDYVRDKKELPVYTPTVINLMQGGLGRLKKVSLIMGPAGRREIISRPKALTVPRGLYGEREEYYVKLKFFVSGKGIVYDAKPIVSSGHPEIDLQAIRFLKRWRFSPSRIFAREKSVWGIMAVKVATE